MEWKLINKAKQLLPAPSLPSPALVSEAISLRTAAVVADLRMAVAHLIQGALRGKGMGMAGIA